MENRDRIKEYLDGGGSITVVPPQPDRKPTKAERKAIKTPKIPKPPKNGHDPNICQLCRNKGYCPWPCHPLSYTINGIKAATEEPFDPDHRPAPTTDYKDVLIEMMKDREESDHNRLEAIRAEKNPMRKLIAACLLAGMTQQNIASKTHISQTRISRIYQGVR